MVPLAVSVNVLTVVLGGPLVLLAIWLLAPALGSRIIKFFLAGVALTLTPVWVPPCFDLLLSLFEIIADVYDEAIAFWGALFKRACHQVARDASLNQAWCLPSPIPPLMQLAAVLVLPALICFALEVSLLYLYTLRLRLFFSSLRALAFSTSLSLRFPATAAFWTLVGFRRLSFAVNRLSSQTLLHIKGVAISSWARTSSLGLDFFRIIDSLEMEFWSIIDQGFCLALRHLNLDRFKTHLSEIYSSWVFGAATTAFLAHHLPALALAGSKTVWQENKFVFGLLYAGIFLGYTSMHVRYFGYPLSCAIPLAAAWTSVFVVLCHYASDISGGAHPSPDPSLHQRVLDVHSGVHVIEALPPAAADPEPAQRSSLAPAQRPTGPQAPLPPTPSSLLQAAVQLSRPPNPAPSSSDSSSGSDWDSDYDLDDYEVPDNHEYEQFPGRYNSPDNHNYVEPPDNDWTPVLSRRALVGQLSPILEVSSVASVSSMSALAMSESESESEFESTTPPVSPLRAKVTQAFLSPPAALTQASLTPRPPAPEARVGAHATQDVQQAGAPREVLQVDKAPAREIQLCTPAREVRQVPKARAQRDMAAFRSFSAALNLRNVTPVRMRVQMWAEDAEDLQSNGAVGLSGDGGECDIKTEDSGGVVGGRGVPVKLEFDPSKVEFERPCRSDCGSFYCAGECADDVFV
ncbi:hypothetical protein B0H13DRAFT_2681780 [Mycena leptocephala]|nr:hypothetical protein B0H13DRAFT_2681780 [Mycena leptocephala]